jgi:hypothetical protein
VCGLHSATMSRAVPPTKAAPSVKAVLSAKAGTSAKVTSIKTWVRIRPLATEGEKGGHADGERVEKELGAFDESSVKIISHDQRGKETAYSYPSKVFPVECAQEAVGGEVLPTLLDDFWNEKSVMLFAYGQTGTGKTTTMFGFPESLTSESEDPGWGLLPRAVHATLARNAEQAQKGVHSVLLLSAVEFYAFMAFDLADVAGKQMCTMKGHHVLGNTYTQCDSPAILKEFIERVYGNRKVVATKMNEGSSRSHCAIILTLLSLDVATQAFKQTQFSIVDLAGAERPEKALGERISKEKAMQEVTCCRMRAGDPSLTRATRPTACSLLTGRSADSVAVQMIRYMKTPSSDMSPGLQGFLINFELSNLLTEVVTATNAHKAGRQYKSSGFGNSASIAYFGGALAGTCRLGVIICLSQARQNGWETWYSIANYGKQLALTLYTPSFIPYLKPFPFTHLPLLHRQAARRAQDACAECWRASHGQGARRGREGGGRGRRVARERGQYGVAHEVRTLPSRDEGVHRAAAPLPQGAAREGGGSDGKGHRRPGLRRRAATIGMIRPRYDNSSTS